MIWILRVTAILCSVSLLGPATISAQEADADEKDPRQESLQLEPSRKIQQTFTEGSWISVDISPDGETLVFDFLGDIYTMPADGGTATALTQGMGLDAQPRFSPDGTRVVFTSDRNGGENLWIMSLDGADTVQVTRGKTSSYQSPEWTPDGDYILSTKSSPGNRDLWMYHVDGGSGVRVLDGPNNLQLTGAAFGGDDRFIWMATGSRTYNSNLDDYQIAMFDRDTGELSTEVSRYGGAFRPTLSPDGRWMVYGTRHVANTALRLRDLRTGAESWLAFPVQRDDQEASSSRDAYPGMTFTPDSREVIATYGGKLWRIPVDGSDPEEIPFRVNADVDLGPLVDFKYPIEDTPTFMAKQIRNAVPSPDGSRIAFTVMGELYVMSWPDGTPRQVTEIDGLAYDPAWSPDGADLAFGAMSSTNEGHLYRVPVGGGAVRQLTTSDALYQDPVWSPDGERIVAVRDPSRLFEDALERGATGGGSLVWVPSSGGEHTVIANNDGLRGPHFVSNSDKIYASAPGGRLVSVRWDGTDRTDHIQLQQASRVTMAPVGDQALAQIVNDIYVVTVPRVGGDAPSFNIRNPDSAPVPAKKLTDVGGEFASWNADGTNVHWSIANTHIVYNLDAAEAFADSVKAAKEAEADQDPSDDPGDDPDTDPDDEEADHEEADDEDKYQPEEVRIEISFDRDLPSGVVVLRGARIITMNGQEVIENGDVVIRGNRIEAVGPSGQVTIPSGAEEIDVSGRTIVPGYIDTHAHLRAAYNVHRSQPWAYAANLAFGVTTARDPQTGSTDVLTYEDMVRAGRTLGPRVYSTGPGVFSSENIRNLDHARDVLTRYSEYYDTKTIKMYGAGNREQRQWIIDAARELELMPTTEGGIDLKGNLTMAIDGYSGTEHNLPGFPFYDDVVQLVAQSRMATTPTILVTYGGPWAENYYYATEDVLGNPLLRTFTPFEELHRKAVRRPSPGPGPAGWFLPEVHTMELISEFIDDVVKAGGRAGVGSHGQLQGLGYHWELWSVGSAMDPHDALRVATLLGAESLGLDQDLGSIEAGKLADLVILTANPLDDLRNSDDVELVMRNGRLYESATLNEVWPTIRSTGPFYWSEGAVPATRAGIR